MSFVLFLFLFIHGVDAGYATSRRKESNASELIMAPELQGISHLAIS